MFQLPPPVTVPASASCERRAYAGTNASVAARGDTARDLARVCARGARGILAIAHDQCSNSLPPSRSLRLLRVSGVPTQERMQALQHAATQRAIWLECVREER